MSLIIKHDLHLLSPQELTQYLRDVSEFIGLDPDLNGLDTIWMENETGPGKSLVVYARRGTAEILRNLYGVEVDSLTYAQVNGSIVFTSIGRAKERGNRQEIAVGSKYINGLVGKPLDDSIMTASTRALRRLTMQFTTLGILDESEVVAIFGQTANPAGSAQLAANPTPPVFLPPPAVPANNAPGKPVLIPATEHSTPEGTTTVINPLDVRNARQTRIAPETAPKLQETASQTTSATRSAQSDIQPDTPAPATAATPVESADATEPVPATKAAKKTRKKANTVTLDVEPEVYSAQEQDAVVSAVLEADRAAHQAKIHADAQAHLAAKAPATVPPQADVAVPTQANPAVSPPVNAAPIEGLPTKEQMDEYRKKVSVYTVQLPASQDLGSTQKMRAFITKTTGTPPAEMTVEQWEEIIAWFDSFVERNQVKGLVKYINDLLGVK